jgi:hypothetical protein
MFMYNICFYGFYLLRSSSNVLADIFAYFLNAYSDKLQNSSACSMKLLPAENNVKKEDKNPNAEWHWNAYLMNIRI